MEAKSDCGDNGIPLVACLMAEGTIQYHSEYCRGLCHCVTMEMGTISHLGQGEDFWFYQVHAS